MATIEKDFGLHPRSSADTVSEKSTALQTLKENFRPTTALSRIKKMGQNTEIKFTGYTSNFKTRRNVISTDNNAVS
jgi:hypothetical protein